MRQILKLCSAVRATYFFLGGNNSGLKKSDADFFLQIKACPLPLKNVKAQQFFSIAGAFVSGLSLCGARTRTSI
jgi:hypothetical protein